MKRFHLEPESCNKCKFSVRPGELKKHQHECPGEMSSSKISDGNLFEYQGWPGSKLPRAPTEKFWPPVKPNKLLVQEDIVGSNSDYKTSSTPAAAAEPMEYDTSEEITNNTNNKSVKFSGKETVDSFVKMRMIFVGDSTINQWMRMKSSVVVWRAMKKFSRLVNVPFKNIQFFWCEDKLTGTESAKTLDGAQIVVRSCMLLDGREFVM